jgi:SAM-dependent methyltransferase
MQQVGAPTIKHLAQAMVAQDRIAVSIRCAPRIFQYIAAQYSIKCSPPRCSMVRFFAFTLFLSAFLLFCCQPMVGKMALPFLGGAASVWTTCILFFQIMLLAGYVYAHLLAKLAIRSQVLLHSALMAAALFALPIGFAGGPTAAATEQPVLWLFGRLILTAGIPFFVVSTTAPLLQSWFSKTANESRHDPYFLYASSNAGSLLALLVYPLLLEPGLGVSAQSRLWSGGYGLLLMMILCAAIVLWRHAAPHQDLIRNQAAVPTAQPSVTVRAYWLAASFVPSALMLAVTNHISVNLTSAPLLWIVPLAIYLITFILAFGRVRLISAGSLSRLAPVPLLLLLPIVPDVVPPGPALNWTLTAGHIVILLLGALLCHTALASRRPGAEHLTEFYFWIALGGALGGVFAAVVAPWAFTTVFEYPLLVALLPFFREWQSPDDRPNRRDWVWAGILSLMFLAAWYVFRRGWIQIIHAWAALLPDVALFMTVFAFRKRRLRFALSYMVLLIGYALTMPSLVEDAERLYVARNFFGVKKVVFDVDQTARKLLHGDTMHGVESVNPQMSGEPLSYYHPSGPVGDAMSLLESRADQRIGVVGLGTGTMAAYGGAHRHVTFFDVDPQVEWIARRFFTYLRRCGGHCDVVIGDGRIGIAQQPDRHFDFVMLDAFSSDSIPAHLVSREAIQLYVSKLKPDGFLLFHVSNRYLDVQNLVAAVLADSSLTALVRIDRDEAAPGKVGSDYVIAARRIEDLGGIVHNVNWQQPAPNAVKPWTDDYSNILALIKWR